MEVVDRVVQASRLPGLLTLCCVSRQFQQSAEKRLYESLHLRDPTRTFLACQALEAQDFARASYVRRFWMWQDIRPRIALPETFWRLVQKVLTRMDNLEDLYMYDDSHANTWIFEAAFPFKLREASLHFKWDQKLVNFLNEQESLKYLCLRTGDDDHSNNDLSQRISLTGHLAELETLECPLHVTFDMMMTNLKRLCFILEDDTVPLFESFLEATVISSLPLTSLNILVIPEFLVADTLHMLASSILSTTLRHLGVLSLPMIDVRLTSVGFLMTLADRV